MILVDTSVWVAHLRQADPDLTQRLEAGDVWCHPFVIGELACGNLRNRGEILSLLAHLPTAPVASHQEALDFIERRRLMARGIGYVDAHLLASAALAALPILTHDRRLAVVAAELGLAE